jgi:hypothetical protein
MSTLTLAFADTRGIAFQVGDELLCIGLHGSTVRMAVTRITDEAVIGTDGEGTRVRLVHDGHHHVLETVSGPDRNYMPRVFVLSERSASI